MDRRNKSRLDLQLLCRIDGGGILSAPLRTLTENLSRSGMLIRWREDTALPAEGQPLTVDVELPPGSDGSSRLMRFETTVIRIVRFESTVASVGLRVEDVRFVEPAKRPLMDLASLTPATQRMV